MKISRRHCCYDNSPHTFETLKRWTIDFLREPSSRYRFPYTFSTRRRSRLQYRSSMQTQPTVRPAEVTTHFLREKSRYKEEEEADDTFSFTQSFP